MVTTFDFEVLEVVSQAPAFLDQAIPDLAGAFPARLIRARIEPDLERELFLESIEQPINHAIIPPD